MQPYFDQLDMEDNLNMFENGRQPHFFPSNGRQPQFFLEATEGDNFCYVILFKPNYMK